MMKAKWVVCAVALGMMAATGLLLHGLHGRLGPAGVKVERIPTYDEKSSLVSEQSVPLPASVLGIPSEPWPVAITERETLPQDTTYGRRAYHAAGSDFAVRISVVLMGTDHTSIHQPQYCLPSQDWNIVKTEKITLPMQRPFEDIPAVKITATRPFEKDGQRVEATGIYVYWFVSGNKITADEGSRLVSMWKTILQNGELERWAYISYFAACLPGHEQETFERLEKFIQASVPAFQLVTGGPAGELTSVAARK